MKRIWNTVKDLTEMFDNTDEGFLLSKCTEDIDCLHFYLSLGKRNASAAFGLKLLAIYIELLFNCKTLDFRAFHQICIFWAVYRKDYLCMAFLRRVLAQCDVPEYLLFRSGQAVGWILESLNHLRDKVKLIRILDSVTFIHDTEILRSLGKRTVILTSIECSNLHCIIKFFSEPFDLVVLTESAQNFIERKLERIDSSALMGPGIRQLQWIGYHRRGVPEGHLAGYCEAWGDLKCCSHMTHLVFNYVWIMPCFVRALSKAMRNGYLPLLEHLSFEGCIFVDFQSLEGDIFIGEPVGPANIFKVGCATLTDLNLKDCRLTERESRFVFLCLKDNTKYSKIKGLELSLDTFRHLPQCLWTNIRSVWLHELDTTGYERVITTVNYGYVPNLNELGFVYGRSSLRSIHGRWTYDKDTFSDSSES